MAKNILLISGSPRKNGNTDKMAQAFKEGAEQAGHTVSVFDAGKKTIKGCIGCNTCFSKGKACSIDDDFNEMAPLFEKADMVVWATPLYYFTFPAGIKSVIDKLYSFAIGGKSLQKESMLLACGGDTEEEGFQWLVDTYNKIASYNQWDNKGVLIVKAVSDKGDIEKTDGLQRATALGASIV